MIIMEYEQFLFRTTSLKYCCREISMGLVKELHISSHLMEGGKVHQQRRDGVDDGQICPPYPLRLNHYSAFKASLTVKGLTCLRLHQGTAFLTFYVSLALGSYSWVLLDKSHISTIPQYFIPHATQLRFPGDLGQMYCQTNRDKHSNGLTNSITFLCLTEDSLWII